MVASQVAQMVQHLPAMQETQVRSLGQEDPLEKEMATHSSTLAWKIPWMEEPGRLECMGSQELDTTEQLHSLELVCSGTSFPTPGIAPIQKKCCEEYCGLEATHQQREGLGRQGVIRVRLPDILFLRSGILKTPAEVEGLKKLLG